MYYENFLKTAAPIEFATNPHGGRGVCDCAIRFSQLGEYPTAGSPTEKINWHMRAADAHSGFNVSKDLTMDQRESDWQGAPPPTRSNGFEWDMSGPHINAHWNAAKTLGWTPEHPAWWE